jgi:hypothetical protein
MGKYSKHISHLRIASNFQHFCNFMAHAPPLQFDGVHLQRFQLNWQRVFVTWRVIWKQNLQRHYLIFLEKYIGAPSFLKIVDVFCFWNCQWIVDGLDSEIVERHVWVKFRMEHLKTDTIFWHFSWVALDRIALLKRSLEWQPFGNFLSAVLNCTGHTKFGNWRP